MTNPDLQNPQSGYRRTEVETACGNRILLSPDTPWVLYRDEVVYFCSLDCKENYLKDPLNSCLAGRILMDRKR